MGYRPVFLTEIWGRWGTAAAVFAIAFAWIGVHLRYALSAATGVPASFTTREGFTIVLPTRDQLRPLAMLAAAVGGAARSHSSPARSGSRSCRGGTSAVRRRGSDSRARRELLCLHAADARSGARPGPGDGGAGDDRLGRAVRLRRRARADAVRRSGWAPAFAVTAPFSRPRSSRCSRSAPGSISRGSSSHRPASFRAPATPTSTRGCPRRWRSRPRAPSAPCCR